MAMKQRHALASIHDRTSRAGRWLWLSWCFAPLLAINNSTAGAALASEDTSVIEQRAWQFTTDSYRKAALQSLLREANTIAHQLQLQENLPIKEAELSEVYICPPGLSDSAGWFGRISTRSYHYSADQANKLCYVEKGAQ
jgi:hypothetical protein